jgi:hypothetical protein
MVWRGLNVDTAKAGHREVQDLVDVGGVGQGRAQRKSARPDHRPPQDKVQQAPQDEQMK